MKNIKWLYPVLALLVCGAGIWLFQNVFKANDYENRLPAQPKALAVINITKLADKVEKAIKAHLLDRDLSGRGCDFDVSRAVVHISPFVRLVDTGTIFRKKLPRVSGA